MEDNEMFLPLKLISQKPKTRNIIVIIFGICIGAIAASIIIDSCPAKHVTILNDLEQYHKTLDPEFCETLLFQIDAFNDECEPQIEIVDCG